MKTKIYTATANKISTTGEIILIEVYYDGVSLGYIRDVFSAIDYAGYIRINTLQIDDVEKFYSNYKYRTTYPNIKNTNRYPKSFSSESSANKYIDKFYKYFEDVQNDASIRLVIDEFEGYVVKDATEKSALNEEIIRYTNLPYHEILGTDTSDVSFSVISFHDSFEPLDASRKISLALIYDELQSLKKTKKLSFDKISIDSNRKCIHLKYWVSSDYSHEEDWLYEEAEYMRSLPYINRVVLSDISKANINHWATVDVY